MLIEAGAKVNQAAYVSIQNLKLKINWTSKGLKKDGETPILVAIKNKASPEVLKILIEAGGDVNIPALVRFVVDIGYLQN